MKKVFSYLTGLFLVRPNSPSKVFRDESAYVDPEYDWQYVVTPGHAIYARITDMNYVGHRLVALVVLAAVLLYFSMQSSVDLTTTAVSPLHGADTGMEAGYLPMKVVRTDQIARNAVRFSAGASDITDAKVLPAFIKASLENLNSSNKLLEPCIQRNSIMSPWVDERGSAKHLLCSVAPSSNGAPARAFVFALVREGRDVKPWLGIFLKEKKWGYKTISGYNDGLYVVPGQPMIDPQMISYTLTADFRDLPTW